MTQGGCQERFFQKLAEVPQWEPRGVPFLILGGQGLAERLAKQNEDAEPNSLTGRQASALGHGVKSRVALADPLGLARLGRKAPPHSALFFSRESP
jgi:hypothetical protein